MLLGRPVCRRIVGAIGPPKRPCGGWPGRKGRSLRRSSPCPAVAAARLPGEPPLLLLLLLGPGLASALLGGRPLPSASAITSITV